MFKILDGRDYLWQWDIDQKLIVDDAICCEVHIHINDNVEICKIHELPGGLRVVAIPDELLQESGAMTVYGCVEDDFAGVRTKRAELFLVLERPKPAAYIFTPTEEIDYRKILRSIGDLTELKTDNKGSLVSAINELHDDIEDIDKENDIDIEDDGEGNISIDLPGRQVIDDGQGNVSII